MKTHEIKFKYQGENFSFRITPSEGDEWFTRKSKKKIFDIHYCEDYNEICVYIVPHQISNSIYSRKISEPIKVDLLYRCGANYKTICTLEINTLDYPEAKDLKVNNEIEMGEYGTLPEGEFHKKIARLEYDPELDHNLLRVVKIYK
jgi:protein associated with RNAse G/E